MQIDRPYYHGLTRLYTSYIQAKEKYEIAQQAKLTPFRVFREVNPQTSELEETSGLEIKDPITYLIYIIRLEEIKDSDYEPSPYWLNESIAISTYEQFKIHILRLNPWDFFNFQSKKLTYLSHFVEEYLDRELNSSGKKHLIDLLKQLEVDLRVYHERFWERIKEKLTVFPSTNVSEMIEEKLDKVHDFIDRNFLGKKEFCIDWQAFQAHKEAIVKDLEVRLTEGSYKHINNPTLFLTTITGNNSQFNNITGFNNSVSNNSVQEQKTGKDWTLPQEQVENGSNFELPLKSEIAENMNIWGAQRAYLTKDQQTKHITQGPKVNELAHFSDSSQGNTQTSDNNQTNTGNSNSYSSQESFNVALLEWMDRVIDKYLSYEDILTKLDKHFVYTWIFGC